MTSGNGPALMALNLLFAAAFTAVNRDELTLTYIKLFILPDFPLVMPVLA